MTDRDALLRAICDVPDDDAPRLVYADWLDEHGDPRQAEFIRLHIAGTHADRFDLARTDGARIMELWRDLRKWRYVLGDWRSFYMTGFTRGFNSDWRGTVTDFLRVVPTPWRFGPITTLSLDFDEPPPGPPALAETIAGLAALPRLKVVRLVGNYVNRKWSLAVGTCPAAARWESFQAWDGD